MTSFLAMTWEYIFGAIGIVAALLLTWHTGKSKGQVETQAKADVKEAKSEAAQSQAISEKQAETTKAVKDVTQANQSLSDDASRERMRGSKYHSAD